MTIQVICDSSCNVPETYQKSLNIIQVPAWVNFADGTSLRNIIDISDQEFYRRLTSEKHLPTTSQPTPQDFVDVIQASTADEFILACVSSKMSGTYSSAVQAVDLLPHRKMHTYDTLAASMGSGWQVIAGAEAAARGADAAGILAAMESSRSRVHTFFTIDTLKYLAASGRAPMLQAMLGTLLDIKPMMKIHDGALEMIGRVRGRKRALRDLIELLATEVGEKPLRVAVVNANAAGEATEYAAQIQARLNVKEIFVQELGPALGALAGPGTLAIAAYVAD